MKNRSPALKVALQQVGRRAQVAVPICGESGRDAATTATCRVAPLPIILRVRRSNPVARPLEEGAEPEVKLKSSSPERQRYSPERAYRPRVSPPSVEDKDACAIYASVRKDATPATSRSPSRSSRCRRCSTAPATSTARATAAACWSTSPPRSGPRRYAQGGHNPSLALDDAFAVAHIFVERSADLEQVRHDAREILGRRGFRILAERVGAVDSAALGPDRARGGAALLAARRPRPRRRRGRPRPLRPKIELEEELGVHVASFSATPASTR